MAKLIIITGPMFSYKTQSLKTRLERKQFAGLKTLVIKTDIGLRNGPRDIPAEIVRNKQETLKLIHKLRPDFIGVEEGQFFGEWFIEVIDQIMEENVATNLEIVVVGLDMDCNKKPFGIIPVLMAKANEVFKVTAICSMCKKDANLSYLLKKEKIENDANINLVKAGDKDEYDSRCPICHNLPH